jgi:DNA-directed RNA polymerase
LNSTLEKLTLDLGERKQTLRADRNIHTFFLKEEDPKKIIIYSFGHILKGIERQATLVDIAVTLGRRIRQKYKKKRDTIGACHVGWFILISFIEVGLLSILLKHTKVKKGKLSKYPSYIVVVKNKKELFSLWDEISATEEEIDLFPTKQKPAPWASGIHETGIPIIKKSSNEIISKFSKEQHQYLFDVLNKLGSTPWLINTPVLEVLSFFMENDTEKTPLKFKTEKNHERRESLLIETSSIIKLARRHQDDVFYHLYNYDFRGRIYPNTAFLHEQSSDTAKGLLLFAEGKQLGDDGLYWLFLHGANSWGYDKASLDDRVNFSSTNYERDLRIAANPCENTEWIDAEKPWSYLAYCFELSLLQAWIEKGNEQETFVSNLPIYIDGSVNGTQHLTAMSKDEIIAPLCNLVPTELPGDMYTYIADKVWQRLKEKEAELPDSVKNQFDIIFSEVNKLQAIYEEAESGSEKKARAFEEVQTWRNNHRKLRELLFPAYWNRITDKKERRKIVKRNVMVLGYGGTPYGFGQQIIEDTKDLSEYLSKKEHLWAAMLGNLVYKTCYEELKGPATMLRLFESIAEKYNEKVEYLSWSSPITNFPVVQNYRQPISSRTKLKYGNSEFNVVVENWEEATLDAASQKSGASPNIVHSLDAVHLSTVIHDTDYPIAAVHDSFGCRAGDMGKLFYTVREKFLELYEQDPLLQILKQFGCENDLPKRGKLKLEQILESDYAFA